MVSIRNTRHLIQHPDITKVTRKTVRLARFLTEEYVKDLTYQVVARRGKRRYHRILCYSDLKTAVDPTLIQKFEEIEGNKLNIVAGKSNPLSSSLFGKKPPLKEPKPSLRGVFQQERRLWWTDD